MPDWKQEILKRLAGLKLIPAREAEIVEELSQHLEDRFRELVAGGKSEEEARRIALEELTSAEARPGVLLRDAREAGGEDGVATAANDLARGLQRVERASPQEPVVAGGGGGKDFLASLWQDVRFALRMLRKNPGFTAVAVLTLALGIGANTTVFTVINTLVLNPIPVEKPSELVGIYSAPAKPTRDASLLQLSYPNLQDLQEENRVFSSVAGFSWPMYITVAKGATSERMFAEFVTGNYFDTLGIHPARGRFFLPQENRAPGESPVAVLSYGAWKSRFEGAPDIVGRTILLNRVALTVVGVAPQGFLGVSAVFGPDVWVPAAMSAQLFPNQPHDWLHDRGNGIFIGAARLKDGVNIQHAQADLKDVAANLEREYPETNRGRSVELEPLNDVGLSLQQAPREGGGQSLLLTAALLMAIVGIVLLIACSNVANLLMARAASRRQEMAVRLALGAGRRRLSRQLLTENVLLALFGGVAGLLLASAGTKFLWSFRPPEFAQNLADLKFNGSVFVFTLVVSLVTALIFGMVPALRSSRAEVTDALKDDSRTCAGPSRRGKKFANALLAGQVGLSLVSLITAALFLRSVERAYQLDPGFDTAHTAMFFVSPGQAGYDHTRAEELYREIRDRVSALRGIRSVSWSSNLPLWGRVANDVLIEGRQTGRQSEAVSAVVNTVDLDYFATVRIPLLRGRDFTAGDTTGSLPVAIVNETMAEMYWPGQDAIGKRFRFTGEDTYRQIIGVAKTANYTSLGESPQSCVYLPLRQNFADTMVLYLNSSQDPAQTFTAVQDAIRQLDPQLPVYDFRTGHKIIDQALFSAKLGVGLLGVFGVLALCLACVGLYGVMAYSVNQRRHEIGVRMALGADSGRIMRQMLRQGAAVIGTGLTLGLAASLLIDRGLSSLLFGVSPADPISVAGSCLALASVAFVACYLPARRATKVDPMVALRYE